MRVIDNAGLAHLLLPLILHIPLGHVVLRSRAAVRLRAAINHMHSIVGIVRFWPARSSKTAPTANNSWKDSRRLVENCRVAGLRCQPADHPPALRAISRRREG